MGKRGAPGEPRRGLRDRNLTQMLGRSDIPPLAFFDSLKAERLAPQDEPDGFSDNDEAGGSAD